MYRKDYEGIPQDGRTFGRRRRPAGEPLAGSERSRGAVMGRRTDEGGGSSVDGVDSAAAIRREFGIADDATPEMLLVEDLEFDSLKLLDLVAFIEELTRYGDSAFYEEYPLLETLGDASDYYLELVEGRRRPFLRPLDERGGRGGRCGRNVTRSPGVGPDGRQGLRRAPNPSRARHGGRSRRAGDGTGWRWPVELGGGSCEGVGDGVVPEPPGGGAR